MTRSKRKPASSLAGLRHTIGTSRVFYGIAVYAIFGALCVGGLSAAERPEPVCLDDSPFCFQELFEPFELVRHDKITNPVLVKGLVQEDENGNFPEVIDAELFFDFVGRNARDLGAHWSRTDVTGGLWRLFIERQRGRYDWSGADAVITAQRKRGVHLLCRISPGTAWGESRRKGPPEQKFPSDMEGYRRFVNRGVERYDGDGIADAPGSPRVECWQIHNEPDGSQFWRDTPEKFAQLHRITYGEIKAADPTAAIVLAGCATHRGLKRFYDPLLADLGKDGKRWFDIADFHFNQSEFWPSPQGDYRGLIRAVHDFRAALDRNGFQYAPIWITECGIYSGQPPAGGPLDRGPRRVLPLVTEHDHAADLVRRYVLAIALGVKKIFWNGMLERFAERRDGYFAHTGLIYDGRFDPPHITFGDRKLAFYAYEKMVEMLGESDWDRVRMLSDGSDGVFCIQFPRKEVAGSVFVAWAAVSEEEASRADWPGRSVQIPLTSADTPTVAVLSVPEGKTGVGLSPKDVVFKKTPVQVSNGTGSVVVGATPIYVEN